jgi:hypothetical protein
MKCTNNFKENDWLELFHDGDKDIRNGLLGLKQALEGLKYTFPHIAEDLRFDIENVKTGLEKLNEALNINMSESMNMHNEFVGKALSAAIHLNEGWYK